MKIAGELCVYTNHHTVIELLEQPQEPILNKPIFGYWNIRGKGAQIRYLLAYCGVDFD